MIGNKKYSVSGSTLLLVTLFLLAIGLLMVLSASFVVSVENYGDPYYFVKRQLLWIAIGLVGMLLISCFPYRHLKRLSLVLLLLNYVFLVMIFVGFGTDLGTDAKRWISLGNVVVQPAEFSKLAFIIFTAAFMSSRRLQIKNFWSSSFVPIILVGIAFFMIQLQPDLGTALVVIAGSALVILVAGMPASQAAGIFLFSLPPLAYFTVKEEYRMQRIFSFLDPWADPTGSGYQIIQSLYALGPGGLFGSGLGRSRQKLFYLPEPQNDFIFAVIGEELGFFGCVAVILLYLVFFWCGMQISLKAPDLFGSLLAAGITFTIAIQVITNIAVVTGLLPVTGINLPLISVGGSSVFFTLLGVGILLNISKSTGEKTQTLRRA